MNVVPTAAPVTNCPAARACHSERTGTPASPSAAVIISDPVIHGSGKFRNLAMAPPTNATAKVASRMAVVTAMSFARCCGASADGAPAADCGGASLALTGISSREGWDIACGTAEGGFILDFGLQRQCSARWLPCQWSGFDIATHLAAGSPRECQIQTPLALNTC